MDSKLLKLKWNDSSIDLKGLEILKKYINDKKFQFLKADKNLR